MRIVFMGTPAFAVPTLLALHEAGHVIPAAYTQPPRPSGRGKQLQTSPVHQAAEALGLPVCHPDTLRDMEAQANFLALEPEVAVVVAYGLILPEQILTAPRHGCLNVHASLLPRWRGAAPIQRAIMAGDPVTGVTIMRMEAGLDTGPMLSVLRTPVEDKTAGELTAELAEIGARLMVETLHDLPDLQAEPQDDLEATRAPKIDKAEARIDWSGDAEALERQVRGLSPFPGAWFELDGERVKVMKAQVVAREGKPGTTLDDELTVACGYAALRPVRIQRAGKPAMDVGAFLRGKPIPAGTLLS